MNNFERVILAVALIACAWMHYDARARLSALESRVDGLTGATVSKSANIEAGEIVTIEYPDGSLWTIPCGMNLQMAGKDPENTMTIPGPTMDAIVCAVLARMDEVAQGDPDMPRGEKP